MTEQDHYPGPDKGKNLTAVEGGLIFSIQIILQLQDVGGQNRDMGCKMVVTGSGGQKNHMEGKQERKKPAKRETAGPE